MLQFSQKRFVAWGTYHSKREGVDLLLVKKGFSAIKIFEFVPNIFFYNVCLLLNWFDMIKLEYNNIAVCKLEKYCQNTDLTQKCSASVLCAWKTQCCEKQNMGKTDYGILLPKLFWPTVRKNCSSDRGWRPRISIFLRSLEQFFQTVKGQNNFW